MLGAKGLMYANCTQVILKKYYTHIRVRMYVCMYRDKDRDKDRDGKYSKYGNILKIGEST